MAVDVAKKSQSDAPTQAIPKRYGPRLKHSSSLPAIASILLLNPLLLAPLSVHAQEQRPSEVSQPRASAQNYDIQSGPLGSVLSEFASVSGIVLSFPSTLTADIHSGGLQGQFTIEEAFAYLLSGTGLEVSQRGAADYVIGKELDSEATLLSTIVIEGESDASAGYLANASATGSKLNIALVETPRSISVITEDQLHDRQVQTIEQAVAYTAGVRIDGAGLDPRFDTVNIRGFTTVYNGDFLDGLRQPNSGWLSYYSTLPYNLERIDVVKGPDSVLYGQLSPGGLINRVSKRPNASAPQEVQFQMGSHDHLQGQFDVGARLGANVQGRLVGLLRDAQTDIEQVDDDAAMLAPTLKWNISEKTDITFIGQYQDRLTAASPRPYQDGETLTRFWAGDEDFDKLDQQQWALGYELNHAFSEQLTLQQNVRYGQVDTINQYLSVTGRTDNILERSSIGLYEDMDTLSTDTRLISKLSHGPVDHQLLFGYDYAKLEHQVEYIAGSAPSIDMTNPDYHQYVPKPEGAVYSDDNGRTSRQGIYAQDHIKVNNWTVMTGVRRDWADDKTLSHITGNTTRRKDQKTTWQLGALYLFRPGLSSYFSFAQSFVPQTGQSFDGSDFDPTEGEQYEIGAKYQPEQMNAMFTTAVYQITESNRLTSDPLNSGFQVESGEVRTRGVEFEAVGSLNEQLQMTASYNYNAAIITHDNDGYQDNDLALTPRHLGSFRFDYSLASFRGLKFGGGVRYTGSEYIDNANSYKNDGYALYDLDAHYDFGGALTGVRLSLNAANITDEEHISCQGSYCYRGPGRSLIGSVAFQW